MTFDDLFAEYYTQYRAEAQTPASTDDEYTVFLRYANSAINRWENYDATYWKELFTTLQDSTQVSPVLVTTISTGVSEYDAPTNMREAGGLIDVKNSDGRVVQQYPIINPQEAQFRDAQSTYAYFTGNPTDGFTLHLNPAPTSNLNGLDIDYVYYKKATKFVSGGSETTEMANPMFIVHHALYPRFRASRNPYLNTALRDAEEALKNMQQDNNSGTWANPPTVGDTSITEWGM